MEPVYRCPRLTIPLSAPLAPLLHVPNTNSPALHTFPLPFKYDKYFSPTVCSEKLRHAQCLQPLQTTTLSSRSSILTACVVLTRHNGSVDLQGNKRGIGIENLLHIAPKLRLHCKADATLVTPSPRHYRSVAQNRPELSRTAQSCHELFRAAESCPDCPRAARSNPDGEWRRRLQWRARVHSM